MQNLKTRLLALAVVIASAAHAAPAIDANEYGSTAIAGAGNSGRVIEVTPQTRYVNVTQGELVTLKVDGQAFTWHVSTFPNVNAIPLAKVAPGAGPTSHVTVYVSARANS